MSNVYDRPQIDGRVTDLENAFAKNGIFITKGTLGSTGTYKDISEIPKEKINVNDRYKVLETGTYTDHDGNKIEAIEGDYIYCYEKICDEEGNCTLKWGVTTPSNIEGPESSIQSTVPIFKNTNGNILDDSKYKISDTTVTEEERILAVKKDIEIHNSNESAHTLLIPDSALNATSIHPLQNKAIYTELLTKANDADVVHISGDETIYGNKTFTNKVIIADLTIGSSGTTSSSIISGTCASSLITDVAYKLGTTTIGSEKQGIYLNGGTATAMSSTIGGENKPVYINEGNITEFSTTIGNDTNFIYMTEGTICNSTKSLGDYNQFIYLKNGSFNETSENIGNDNQPVYMKNGQIIKTLISIGDSVTPVYLNSGVITQGEECVTVSCGTKEEPEIIYGVKTFSGHVKFVDAEATISGTITSAESAIYASSASVATQLGTATVGNAQTAIYLDNGIASQVSIVSSATNATIASKLGTETIGNTQKAIYLYNGMPREVNVVSSATNATNATIASKIGTVNIGDANTPVYVDLGVVKSTGKSFASYLPVAGGTITGNLTVNGTLTANKVYGAVWNDYAELFPKGEETEPGDIIALDESNHINEQYIKATNKSKFVVGVHSNSFGYVLGGDKDTLENNMKKYIPIGLSGRLEVKFIGKSVLGEGVVPSDIPGVGKLCTSKSDKKQIVGYIVFDSDPNSVEERKVKIKIKG